jgi:N4-gp56 family major capsid protein
VNPDAGGHEITAQEVDIEQYGYFVKGTDVVKAVSYDPLLDEVAKELGAQAGQSIDEITRDVLVAGSAVYYAAGNTARNQIVDADVLAAEDLIAARATLVDALAKPIRGSNFVAIIHPLTHADLLRDDDIRTAMNAGDHRSELFKGQVMEFAGISFVESGLAKVFTGAGASSANVYATMVFGKDAYGITELSGMGMEMIFHNIGSSGVADPLNRFWTSGWKTSHAVKRLREEFMLRIEHGCTNG